MMNQLNVSNRRPSIDIVIILTAWIIGAYHLICSNAFRPAIWRNYTILDELEAKDWNKSIITLRDTFSSPPAGFYLHAYKGVYASWTMKLAFFIGGMNSFFSLAR